MKEEDFLTNLWSFLWSLKEIFFILTHSTVFSAIEVELEAAAGWAVNLPTDCAFLGWTFYHVYMNVLVLLTIFGITRIYESDFSKNRHKYIWTVMVYVVRILIWFCVEDIMWFILNPSYGLLRYTQEDIYWHADKTWFLGTLLMNWVIFAFVVCVGFVEMYATTKTGVLKETAIATVYLIIACLISRMVTYERTDSIPEKTDCFGSFSTVYNYTL
jgi:hypothetical protein|tara:strand:+ start:91 stop:735 length:645 start_codon:yes stop_codon:yes gene_type:complete